jgi:hypothetical protein
MTKEEKEIIKKLKELEKIWPKGKNWLFSASGILCLMRYKEDGSRALTKYGGMDDDFCIWCSNLIPNDGGDW